MAESSPNLVRNFSLVAVAMGLAWGPLFAFMGGHEIDATLMGFSALFGILMGGIGYWRARRLQQQKGDEALKTHCRRTLAAAAGPLEVFRVLHDALRASPDYDVTEASEEFLVLRALCTSAESKRSQEVTLHVAPQGDGSAVQIDSRTRSPRAWLDLGGNQQNVEQIAGMLIDRFPADTALHAQERRVQQAASARPAVASKKVPDAG